MICRILLLLLSFLVVSCERGQSMLRGRNVEPGEKLVLSAEKVWDRYDCADRRLPFLIVEENELNPKELEPGEELHHHFVYVMCPSKTWRVIKGNLYRKVSFQDKVVFQDVTNNVEFRPGKWDVDAFITVPEQAQSGTYFLNMVLSSKIATIEKNLFFVVED